MRVERLVASGPKANAAVAQRQRLWRDSDMNTSFLPILPAFSVQVQLPCPVVQGRCWHERTPFPPPAFRLSA